MNWPNRLTLARLVLTALFVMVLTLEIPFANTIALTLFVIAAITDYLDGYLARKLSLTTNFGTLMDPLADKIMMASAFVCLIPLGAIPAWIVIIIIAREFLITGLRLLAAAEGTVLPAESLGKHKTGWQIATVIVFLLLLSLHELLPIDNWPSFAHFLELFRHYVGFALIAIMTGLTVVSGTSYLWKNRTLLSED